MPGSARGQVDLRNLNGVTFQVRITRELRLRIRLGLALMKLGARVLGARLDIQVES